MSAEMTCLKCGASKSGDLTDVLDWDKAHRESCPGETSERTPKMSTIRVGWAQGHPFPLTTDIDDRYAEFDRALAAHDAEVLRAAAVEIEDSIHHLDPAYPSELSFINCTRIDARLLRERADRAEAGAGVVAEEPEWEYVPGWIAADGRARISQGVIAPSYVADFIAEGGDVVRRRVSQFEAVTADMVPVKQEGADDA